MTKLLQLFTWLLAALGFGLKARAQLRIFVQPSDRLEDATGYDIQIQPTPINEPLPDVAWDALRQSRLGRNVLLWVGGKTLEAFQRLPALLLEAAKYASIQSIYLYDELFWNNDTAAVEIGRHELEVLEAARLSRLAGLKTVIVMLPEVVLHPLFVMRDINAFDLIGIDVYPSLRANSDTYGCHYSDNVIENLLRCSIEQLRSMGYHGDIGYVYQAFTNTNLPESVQLEHVTLQRAVIDKSKEYGVDVLCPWGLYLGATEVAAAPFLVPLGGTPYAHLVQP